MATLLKVSIPEKFRGLMTKEAFDVPDSPEGHAFLVWWDDALAEEQSHVTKLALERDVSIVDAWKAKDDDDEEAE
jgi:hypothetical protein